MWLKEKSEGWLRGPDLNRRPLGYEMLNGQFANASDLAIWFLALFN
jgi:hypothetical protein